MKLRNAKKVIKFERYYSTEADVDYSEYKTILPFFGYSHHRESSEHEHEYGGEIKITHEYGNTFKVEKTPKRVSTYKTYSHSYRRDFTPSPQASNIETKFLEILEKTNYMPNIIQSFFYGSCPYRIPRFRVLHLLGPSLSLWNTPYLEPSLEVFHQRRGGGTILTDCLFYLGRYISIYFILVAFASMEFAVRAFDLAYSDRLTDTCLITSLAVGLIMMVISKLYSKITHSKKTLKQMSPKYKEKLRKRYYLRMRYLYGRKLGKLLKEYSILKEKNQHILYQHII